MSKIYLFYVVNLQQVCWPVDNKRLTITDDHSGWVGNWARQYTTTASRRIIWERTVHTTRLPQLPKPLTHSINQLLLTLSFELRWLIWNSGSDLRDNRSFNVRRGNGQRCASSSLRSSSRDTLVPAYFNNACWVRTAIRTANSVKMTNNKMAHCWSDSRVQRIAVVLPPAESPDRTGGTADSVVNADGDPVAPTSSQLLPGSLATRIAKTRTRYSAPWTRPDARYLWSGPR